MKVGKYNSESPYCGEEEDVEEESGRIELQTAKKNGGGGPLSACLKADNLFSHVIYRKRRPGELLYWKSLPCFQFGVSLGAQGEMSLCLLQDYYCTSTLC